jgi:small subunit ribosomal protein S3Ae
LSKGTRKLRDKWRIKNWYSVFTPSYFGELNIASIPSADPKNIIGRVIETTLYDITGDFSHQSIKLYFLIVDVKGDRAETIMKGHEYSADFLRSLVKRGSSRIDGIFNVTTKDGYITRASIVAFTHERIKSSQESEIRKIMKSVIEEKAKKLTYGQICHEMVLGKIGSDIYNLAKKITPLRHVGVRKSKLLAYPTLPFKAEKEEVTTATNR